MRSSGSRLVGWLELYSVRLSITLGVALGTARDIQLERQRYPNGSIRASVADQL